MRLITHGATDPGRKRANNEDAYLLDDRLCLYAVADGVGGFEGGEIASRIAVDTLGEAMPDLLGDKDRTPPAGHSSGTGAELSALRSAFTLANRTIRAVVGKTPGLAGMGTTLTALLLAKKRAYLAHIGDSRAYLFRSGELIQMTNDHSVVAEQVRAGLLTAGEARSSPYRHVITRALGIVDDAAPDLVERPVQANDTFLLCSDGLTEMVDDVGIRRVLSRPSPADAVKKLIEAANSRGGVDNITAVVVQVLEV
jgi:serine/threonine protein phosphatase PrpC